jgi:hypothetical protein
MAGLPCREVGGLDEMSRLSSENVETMLGIRPARMIDPENRVPAVVVPE